MSFSKKLKFHEPLRRVQFQLFENFTKIAGRCFLKPFFSHSRKLFSESPYKIVVIALHDIIGLQNFSSSSRITMCNLHWCYTFCTGVTLELHCSQQIRIEIFFHVYYYKGNILLLCLAKHKLFFTGYTCIPFSLPTKVKVDRKAA